MNRPVGTNARLRRAWTFALVGAWALASTAHADIRWTRHDHQSDGRFEAAVRAHDAPAALQALRGVERGDAMTRACLEAFLLEVVVAGEAGEQANLEAAADVALAHAEAHSLGGMDRVLLDFARAGWRLGNAYTRCATHPDRNDARAAQVLALQEDFARAEETVLAAMRASNDLQDAFRREWIRLKRAMGPAMNDPWPAIVRTYGRLPRALANHPPRTFIPAVATGVLTVGFGLSSLISMVGPLSEGRSLRGYPAASWGLAIGLLGSMPAAFSWYRPTGGLYLVAATFFVGTTAYGSWLATRESRARRSLGQGFLIGAGVNLALSVGSLIRNRQRRRVAFSPLAFDGGGGLQAHGRF